MMSGKLRNALMRVPHTKPSWTAIVSQPTAESPKFHSTRNAGSTAAALNQSDMPNNSARDSRPSARQRAEAAVWFVCSFVGCSPTFMNDRREYYKLQCGLGPG